MYHPLLPPETVISSLDVLLSDDEDEREMSPNPNPSNSSSSGNSIKGRNTAAMISRPGRASKVNALLALNSKSAVSLAAASSANAAPSASSSTGAGAPLPIETGPSPKKNPVRKALQQPKAPPLDLSTIRSYAPRYPNPPPRPTSTPTRMFGLEHAPVYHPTIEEFSKPMEYIEKISVEAKAFGICKIVPPEGWRPPFALDTETFRFKTRLQRLNSMEASARASLNFLEQLHIYHRQQGNSRISVPSISGKPVDLWKLKREVSALGGYTEVTTERKWNVIAKNMGYSSIDIITTCAKMKASYLKIVVPFEDYVKRVRLAGGTPPPDPSILNNDSPVHPHHDQKRSGSPAPNDGANSLATPMSDGGEAPRAGLSESDIQQVQTASDKLNAALSLDPDAASSSSLSSYSSSTAEAPRRKDVGSNEFDDTPGEVCEICTMDNDPHKIVLCDGCDRGFHLTCLSPPLSEVPVSQFFCDTCLLMNGAEYGFEEGEDHSLHSFRRRADAFKRQWLKDHPLPDSKGKGREVPSEPAMDVDGAVLAEQIAIEDHFEREFWRLVESQNESVEIEYGADVNHTRDGGGLPNLEVHPNDPYSRDGWNLNNLPILAGSLLRYIKSDISGMTIPWIYVGMVFSTFAWHKEDHYTYSINYHHWGDTKTWYGIPADDDEKLEAAMKLAAPELFEQQPDLMFQLVTLMSPGRLKKHGVRVVACDQRPNEFVITFPRAYHSGFNHGFNFNEAVNFALPDWLPVGLQCVKRYKDIKKPPVFSHDELLVTIALHEKNPRNSKWLLPNWTEMIGREFAARAKVRQLLPDLTEEVDATEIEEEDYQCVTCRQLFFLSFVTAPDGPAVACHDHYSDLPEGPKVLRLRFSDQDLKAMFARVKSRSDRIGRPSDAGLSDLHDGRTTGRKRKPSALALEAEASTEPFAQKPKTTHDEPQNVNHPPSSIVSPLVSLATFPSHSEQSPHL